MRKSQIFTLFLGVIVFFTACRREVSWDNRVAAPLFKSSLSLGQIDSKYLDLQLLIVVTNSNMKIWFTRIEWPM